MGILCSTIFFDKVQAKKGEFEFLLSIQSILLMKNIRDPDDTNITKTQCLNNLIAIPSSRPPPLMLKNCVNDTEYKVLVLIAQCAINGLTFD